jgi:2-polyprenyl-3-methyl-5-hydroxy-6-metoxy-1,4-benzoquinol methylase
MGENQISDNGMTESAGTPPAQYTHGHADAVLRSHRWRTAENSAAYLLPLLRPGLRVIDIGCGPGTLSADIARRVAPAETLGLDPAPEVIAEASRMLESPDLENLSFAVGDLFAIGDEVGRFDVVHAHQVLQHLVDPVAALRAMATLLDDGGIVAARDADYSAMTWFPAEPLLDRWLDIYRRVTTRNGAECDAGRRLLHWARQADFGVVSYSTSTWTYSTADELRWWCGLWADRITSTRLADQAIEYGIADRDELEAIGRAWRTWGERDGAVFFVPHGEIIARSRDPESSS